MTHKPGPSVRVVSKPYGLLVISSPHPIHHGTVVYAVGRWVAMAETIPGMPYQTFHRTSRDGAIQWLGGIVGAEYRKDMRRRYTGPQRRAMGLGQCPAHIPCRLPAHCPIRGDHGHLCRLSPASPITVYCDIHAHLGNPLPGAP